MLVVCHKTRWVAVRVLYRSTSHASLGRYQRGGRDTLHQGFFEGQGGAFYNRGEITVDGESLFSLNEASVSLSLLLLLLLLLLPLLPLLQALLVPFSCFWFGQKD